MRDEGDRFVAWRLDDAPATPGANLEEERMERALLAYAQRSAARVGAEWFAAEFARREEDERLERAVAPQAAVDGHVDPSPELMLVDASVEDQVVGGVPAGLGLAPAPQPAIVDIETTPRARQAIDADGGGATQNLVNGLTGQPPQPLDALPNVRPSTGCDSAMRDREPTPEPVILEPEPTPQPVILEPEPTPQPVILEPEPTPGRPILEPEPTPQRAMRHPHVPRPPAPEPTAERKRRRRRRQTADAPTPSFVISAPEWARMSPGARRLYGLDAAPHAAGSG